MNKKSRFLIYCLLLSSVCLVYPQESEREIIDVNYAVNVINQVLKNSPEGKILNNTAESTEMSFRQQNKTWIPSIQFDLSTGARTMQGEYEYVRNGGIMTSPQIILDPSADIGIYQKLPGNGQLSINAGYGFSYLTGQNAYIQQPYLQFGLSQSLSDGAFFLTKDPSIELLKNQQNLFILENKEAKFNLVVRFISVVQNYNLALLENEYYEILLKKATAEYKEQDYRHLSGQRNDIELFNSHMSKTQALQSYQQAYQKLMEAKTLLATYEIEDIAFQSNLFRDEILKLLETTYGEKLYQTMQEYEIMNQIENEKLSLKIDEAKMAPSFFIQTTFAPDSNKNSVYSDLSRSLRDIVKTRYAWTMNATVGISIAIDCSFQRKSLRELSDKRVQNLNLQLDVLHDEQIDMRNLYKEWEISFSAYCEEMEQALREEEQFRKDIKTLMNRNLITEAEYWATEASYYETYLNYYRSVWNMIQGKLNILKLSSDWEEFIQQFMEVVI